MQLALYPEWFSIKIEFCIAILEFKKNKSIKLNWLYLLLRVIDCKQGLVGLDKDCGFESTTFPYNFLDIQN